MHITSTALRPSTTKTIKPSEKPAPEATQASNEDTFSFSSGSISGKEKFQIGTIAVAGGLIGAVPGLGVASNAVAIGMNQEDELSATIAAAGAITNFVATLGMVGSLTGPLPLLIPAAFGAIAWGSYAANVAGS